MIGSAISGLIITIYNADVWHLRRWWHEKKTQIQQQFREGRYRFRELRLFRRDDGAIEWLSSPDALVYDLRKLSYLSFSRFWGAEDCYCHCLNSIQGNCRKILTAELFFRNSNKKLLYRRRWFCYRGLLPGRTQVFLC